MNRSRPTARPRTLARPGALAAAAAMLLAPAICHGQSFNIDLDIATVPATFSGFGAPSSAFGAAAAQPGFWNAVQNQTTTSNTPPITLSDLSGTPTGVTITMSTNAPNGFAHWSFTNSSNTGDFARLLNDAHIVNNNPGPFSNTYTFSGLQPGIYDVITYGVRPMTGASATRVDVTGAGQQTVTGPMPGNAFALGVTHAWHTINLTGSSFTITVDHNTSLGSAGAYANGFQLTHTPVPAPGAAALLALAGAMGSRRRRTTRTAL